MRHRILVIEDTVRWQYDIKDALDDSFTLEFAADPKEATDKFLYALEMGAPYQCILADLDLGTISGTHAGENVIRFIRRRDENVPIIVFSQHKLAIREARLLFVELHVTDGLDKQTGYTDLLETVERALLANSRVLGSGRPSGALPAPVRLLFLAANPSEMPQLKLANEVREIEKGLLLTGHRDAFTLIQQHEVRVTELQELLLRHRPHIVHFVGHGSKHAEIILLDEGDNPCAVAPALLSNVFAKLAGDTRCVVLNTCHSALQAEAIGAKIDCVVGMSGELTDKTATRFATMFYMTLGFGRSVQSAFEVGCLQLELEGLAGDATPRIIDQQGRAAKMHFVGNGP